MRNLYFTICLAFFSINYSFALSPFYNSSARSSGIGNAFISIADDPTAIIENPAGLSTITNSQVLITGSYQGYDFNSRNFSQIEGSISVAKHNFGLTAVISEKGDRKNKIKRKADSLGPYSMKNREFSIFVSSSERLSSEGSIGISLQYIRVYTDAWTQTGEIQDKEGLASHIGLLLPFQSGRLGITLTNIYFQKLDYIVYDDYGNVEFLNSYPLNLNTGLSFYPRDGVLLSFDVRNIIRRELKEKNTQRVYLINSSFHTGVELTLLDSLKIRFGFYRNKAYTEFLENRIIWRNTLTSGFGYENAGFSIDFSATYDERERDMSLKPKTPICYLLSFLRKM